ncbi:UNVERIFIED_CONTAM: hypothetical protein Slati_3959700 [Sesamum latifolium]|uniref:Retroviral polymerase SH3-like domain-containing protein n=1 Tax=Sesamum latifolium TaxID=2727402 RepID=A0AAW2TQF4_9LAMI
MTEGSSVQGHGVKMLSLMEKLEDLKVGLNNDTYIDVILQSLPPFYDPFIVNFNMNGLQKSINELINMLVQYERTTKMSVPSVLVGDASTPKTKGKRAGRWKRKKGKAKAKAVVAAKDAKSASCCSSGNGQGKEKDLLSSSRRQTIFAPIGVRKGIGRAIVPNSLPSKIWYARLGHISQDRVKRLVDSKSLEIDNLDNLPAYICGPLNTQARGGLSNIRTFTDDHSQYGYVYLMRYKSEAFVRFKEFRLEVENQTGHKIKTLRSDRVSEWFIGYPKEIAVYYFYDPSEQKVFVSRNAVFLERGFSVDTRRDGLLLEESSEAPQMNAGTSSASSASTYNVPVLRRLARVPQPPERYGFLGIIGQLDNDPKIYGEVMSDIDSKKWLEAMKSKMDSMSSNQVWKLVD